MLLKPRTISRLRAAKQAKSWSKGQRKSRADYLRTQRRDRDMGGKAR